MASLEASKLLRGGTVQIRSGAQARVERHVAPQRQLRAPSEVVQVEATLSRLEVQLDQMIANHREPRRQDLGHVDPDDPARGSRSRLGSGEAAHAVHIARSFISSRELRLKLRHASQGNNEASRIGVARGLLASAP